MLCTVQNQENMPWSSLNKATAVDVRSNFDGWFLGACECVHNAVAAITRELHASLSEQRLLSGGWYVCKTTVHDGAEDVHDAEASTTNIMP